MSKNFKVRPFGGGARVVEKTKENQKKETWEGLKKGKVDRAAGGKNLEWSFRKGRLEGA